MNLGLQNRMAKEKSMTATPTLPPQTASAELPAVPLTTEGYSVLHQMMRIRWSAWRALPAADRPAMAQEAASVLGAMETNSAGQSALYSLIAHTGDLRLIDSLNSFTALTQPHLQQPDLPPSPLPPPPPSRP